MSSQKEVSLHDFQNGVHMDIPFDKLIELLSGGNITDVNNIPKKDDLKKFIDTQKYPQYYFNDKKIDLKNLGKFVINKVIPTMFKNKETALFYHNHIQDVMCVKPTEYTAEINRYIDDGLTKCYSDTEYFIDYKFKGSVKRCYIITEIWYYEDEDKYIPISPLAHLLGLHTSAGFTFLKIRWD